MHVPVQPDGAAVIELEGAATTCIAPGCGGAVVRHSLGSGQSVRWCVRCFRRYQSRVTAQAPRGRLRRMLDEFMGWRDE